jgi:hypothetical protein
MNPTDKEKAKQCCRQAHEKLLEHLEHCDTSAQNENQRHHCYRHAAWQSGRQARKCIEEKA